MRIAPLAPSCYRRWGAAVIRAASERRERQKAAKPNRHQLAGVGLNEVDCVATRTVGWTLLSVGDDRESPTSSGPAV